jgi:hypothetical protein
MLIDLVAQVGGGRHVVFPDQSDQRDAILTPNLESALLTATRHRNPSHSGSPGAMAVGSGSGRMDERCVANQRIRLND